jgi:hypothetical protein
MKLTILYLILFSILIISCGDDVSTIKVKADPCLKEGIYCKGTSIYTCHNTSNNEATEELIKTCDSGEICLNEECVLGTCDEVINCILGEKKCVNEKSYKTCGNYDSDSCLEWKAQDCNENFRCEKGECIPDIENPCNLIDCVENSSCQVENGLGVCICDNGYHDETGICVEDCIPDCNNKVCGSDGCGGICGTCSEGTCSADQLSCEICTPTKTCEEEGFECGEIDDGCGNQLDCGGCLIDEQCNEGTCTTIDYCLDITCPDDDHCNPVDGSCISNTKFVPCLEVSPQNATTINEDVQITWTQEEGWSTPSNCLWNCNDGFHLYNNETLCASNIQQLPCNAGAVPNNANYDPNEFVSATWIIANNSEGGYWDIPTCAWTCNTEVSCLSTDQTYCITKVENDYCDGEDNNCDGVIDNRTDGDVENSSCMNGDCFGKIYNNHRYLFCNTDNNWNDAKNTCSNIPNAYLVSINDENENSFINENIDDRFWIGYSQDGNAGDKPWIWIDGSNASYTNWAENEPNNACVDYFGLICTRKENCAEIYGDASWNDADCEDNKKFICEIPLP